MRIRIDINTGRIPRKIEYHIVFDDDEIDAAIKELEKLKNK